MLLTIFLINKETVEKEIIIVLLNFTDYLTSKTSFQ